MPLYYFDFRDGENFSPDEDGLEFPGVDAARDQATKTLAEMAKDVLPGSTVRQLAIEVRDDGSNPILRTVLRFEIEKLR
jgi:hypothetical protein